MVRHQANNFAVNNKENGMARSYLSFGDIEGKLDMLHVTARDAAARGRYNVRRLLRSKDARPA
jgi:hypothetical protein